MSKVDAPPQLLEVASKVDQRLTAILEDQSDRWRQVDPRLSEAVDELSRMVASGGKRLRAAFCYWTWRGFADPSGMVTTPADGPAVPPLTESAVIDVGAAFEFLQVFALIHDDIMDDASTRRGTTTVHVQNARRLQDLGWRGEARRYGEGVAILVGDLGHVYADQLIGPVGGRARQLWDELRIELNLGQYLDMRSAAAGTLDLGTARQVAIFKSALYTIVRPAQMGACLAGVTSDEELDLIDRFGRPLGRAFQLRDDALGLLGDPAELGKPVGDDLREGKPTELVAWALAKADQSQTERLADIGRAGLSDDEVDDLIQIIADTGAIETNEAEIARLVTEALSVLEVLPVNTEARAALHALAVYVAHRTF